MESHTDQSSCSCFSNHNHNHNRTLNLNLRLAPATNPRVSEREIKIRIENHATCAMLSAAIP